ncbi:MAG: M20/M25/M40 family metallo-hydrolase [Candidatus Aenigmarchaeota archaeon]|nr:M20/M25/M40 family metallo-hydrolase [Candidatus Aenigmarchaeota archaeon]
MNEISQKIIKFTKELVVIPSQNGIDSEKAIAHVVFDKLISFGFKPEIIGPKEHSSVICHIKKQNSNKTIWLESCLDTVPAGESKWKYPPFESRIIGNKMYGRGTNDSKVAIAIFCYLAKELVEDKNFDCSIFLGFDADEQSGNFSGIREVLKHAPKADICILGYQGIEEISIGARGWLRLKLTTLGESAHTGSRTKKGINAIHLMGDAITAVSSMNLGNITKPFFKFGSSLNISQINGGVAINIVPDKCEANIDIRLLPSQTKNEALTKINKVLKRIKSKNPLFNYSLEVLQFEQAYLTSPDNAFVKILKNRAEKVLKKDVPLVASGQGSVGNVISQLDIPIINAFGCESDNGHAPNEWVNIESIPKVFEIYKESLKEFATKR